SVLDDRHHGSAPPGSSGGLMIVPIRRPVWTVDGTIRALQTRVDDPTNVGAQLNAPTGKPRFRGAAQPARARWSPPAPLFAPHRPETQTEVLPPQPPGRSEERRVGKES